ncbi:hypothetical protein B0H14DRAFT_2616836 [Mycena olivaceomarginata]|nr:hypothetical protein B0H14DRAFT_2616836 [Mycena olivaceomarginata]
MEIGVNKEKWLRSGIEAETRVKKAFRAGKKQGRRREQRSKREIIDGIPVPGKSINNYKPLWSRQQQYIWVGSLQAPSQPLWLGERVGPEGASGGIGVEHEGEEEMVVDGGDEGEWVEEDEGDDAMEAAVSDLLYTISMVAIDDRGEPPQVQES